MSFAAEERLLLQAARLEPDRDAVAALLREPLDWDYAVACAVRHGVAPLLHRTLQPLAELVPPGPRAELERLASVSAARSERLLETLAELLAAMPVPVLALKDVGLAVEVYREPGLRPLGDLDLLVHEDDYAAVARAMSAAGFAPLPGPDIPFTRRYAWAHHFRRAAGNVWIDVQWNVMQREWDRPGAGRRSFDPALLWTGARTVALPDGTELPVPSREAALYHLCEHLEGHEYGELVLFCDVAEAVATWIDLDWDAVLRTARRYESEAAVHHVLGLAARLLGAPVPEDVLSASAPTSFRAAAHEAIFGGLTSLHLSLDEVRRAVDPPRGVLDRMETLARAQAARARALGDVVEDLAVRFDAAGGELLAVAGRGTARRFPDPRLRAFGDVVLAVCEDDVGLLREVAGELGFAPAVREPGGHVPADGALVRTTPLAAHEPALVGHPLELAVSLEPVSGLPPLDDASPSNREAALSSLRQRLSGAAPPGDVARIVLAGVSREALWAWLLARLGGGGHGVLFRVPPLLDALRRGRLPPDPAGIVEHAGALRAEAAAAAGVALLEQVAPDRPELAALRRALGEPVRPPRVLEWAREGPEALERRGELRSAYLLALCLLESRRGERLPLLLSGGLREAAAGAAVALRRALGSEPAPPAQLVYWLEP